MCEITDKYSIKEAREQLMDARDKIGMIEASIEFDDEDSPDEMNIDSPSDHDPPTTQSSSQANQDHLPSSDKKNNK